MLVVAGTVGLVGLPDRPAAPATPVPAPRPVALLAASTGLPVATAAVPTVVAPTAPPEDPAARASRSDRRALAARPADGPVTSPFGRRWGRLHAGMDFGVPVGSPVLAAADGTVAEVARDAGGYGVHVVLAHPDGTTTLYAHLSRALVEPGGSVLAGQQIALSGNSGSSTGPHLHFEIRTPQGPVDPRPALRERGVEL